MSNYVTFYRVHYAWIHQSRTTDKTILCVRIVITCDQHKYMYH